MEEQESSNFAIDLATLAKLHKTQPQTAACPVCGSREWYALQDALGNVAVLPTGQYTGGPPQFGYVLVALACVKCGFLHQHIKSLLDEYLKGIPNEP